MRLSGTPFAGRDRRLRERALSLSIVLFLHAGFLLLLAQSALRPTLPVRGVVREMMLVLPRLSRPMQERRRNRVPTPPTSTPPAFIPPLILAPPVAPIAPGAPSTDAIQGFGQALNNCAPENYANLPEDQRAKCQRPGAGVAIQELPNLMGAPSHVKGETHWQDELARKQSPTLLPCGGFLNVACLLGKVADGTLADYGDPRTWPNYAVKQLAPEDFYKIEKEYDTWHKDHPSVANTSSPSQ